jgi:hypothetical protein
MINYEVIAGLIVAAFVVAKLIEAIKEPVRPWWEALPDWGRACLQYVVLAVGAALVWFTGLNALPGFSVVWEPLGRILTCLAGGFGPTFVYDMWMDKPKVPADT